MKHSPRTAPPAGGRASRILELAPLAGAILCIAAIGILAAASPRPRREISAFAELERKLARQALAVELASERLRRKAILPIPE